MNTPAPVLLEKILATERRVLAYSSVAGSFWEKKFRRLFQLHYKYVIFFICKLLNLPIKKTVTLFWGEKITVPFNDIAISNLYYFGCLSKKELPLIKYLIKHLKVVDVFYDIGANYGFYTHLSKEIITSGSCHLFEPNERVFSYVARNLAVVPPVVLNNCAVSDNNGTLDFYREVDNGSSGTGTTKADVTKSWRRHYTKTRVNSQTLDTYITNHPVPTIMKLDVEGAEINVLKGAVQLLETYQPTIAMEVWSGKKGADHSEPAVAFLLERGYLAYRLDGEGGAHLVADVDTSAIASSLQNFLFQKPVTSLSTESLE